ncbi:sulfatase-like hydrolase/transferase [Paraburkholderia rhynchosiae]|uniref:Sulfatase n=1 Tax=Paraburkholderia rhynchosiae TaxID=487049 RepID=A0A2N7W4W0_9BURK|nr:sulfatase-like hydrolase/transferase [Paraburkholderia rhynchosiae]PMS24442.1 sulfatase [Paraburkholderia rhynchosiae]CAB3736818.1 Choline-sulfatase [Paraburkholderia rhynchosiae]
MKQSNVLFILSDEHQHALMGCAGNQVVQTPNLDRLAARGTRFENAYTPSPICVPARASLATGRHVHEIRCWDNAIAYDGEPKSWAHRLGDAGIAADSIGKLHYRSASSPAGFRRQISPVHIMGGIGQVWGSVRAPLPETMGRSPLYDQIGPGHSSYNEFDEGVADHAVRWFGERAELEEPWVLFVGFVAPHFPLVVPQRYLDLYPTDSIKLPPLHPDRGYTRHPWVERQAQYMDHDQAIGCDEQRRLAIASYLGLVSFVDDNIGRVLDALREHGLEESTTVIYSSDHGENLGSRGMWNKCLMYRESTGVPMILAGPEIPAGRVCETPVSLLDVQNTILDLLGVPEDVGSPGTSMARLANTPDDPTRTVFSEYHAVGSESAAYMLANKRYKYHYYVGFEPELFDLETDPAETSNLAWLPGYRTLVSEFEAQLRSIVDPEAVDASAKQDQHALIESFGGRESALKTGTPGATPVQRQ